MRTIKSFNYSVADMNQNLEKPRYSKAERLDFMRQKNIQNMKVTKQKLQGRAEKCIVQGKWTLTPVCMNF